MAMAKRPPMRLLTSMLRNEAIPVVSLPIQQVLVYLCPSFRDGSGRCFRLLLLSVRVRGFLLLL
jgi:hypothetical protein